MDLAVDILHVLAAAVWVGGTLVLVFAAVPAIRSLSGEGRASALRRLGRRWQMIGWPALGVLIVTGLAAAHEHGGFRRATLLHTSFGRVLLVKAGLVALLAVGAAAHDFVLGPRLAREIQDEREQRTRPKLVAVGWTNLALTIAIPVLGVVLASEAGH